MFVSILAVIAVITRVDQRAAFMSFFGYVPPCLRNQIADIISIVFVISSVIGPLLGGVFTERVSWRWCFWINLPFGGVAAAGTPPLLLAKTEHGKTGWRQIARMDYVGSGLILACITCLLLALQWGGNDYPWSSKSPASLYTR
jgi:MFS family permease